MNRQSITTKEAINRVEHEIPEKVETMLVIATDDSNNVRTFLFGADHLCISTECIALVAAMRDLLGGKLSIADAIYNRMKDDGVISVKSQTTTHVNSDSEQESDEDGGQDNDEDDSANVKQAMHELIDIVFGGVGCENDD